MKVKCEERARSNATHCPSRVGISDACQISKLFVSLPYSVNTVEWRLVPSNTVECKNCPMASPASRPKKRERNGSLHATDSMATRSDGDKKAINMWRTGSGSALNVSLSKCFTVCSSSKCSLFRNLGFQMMPNDAKWCSIQCSIQCSIHCSSKCSIQCCKPERTSMTVVWPDSESVTYTDCDTDIVSQRMANARPTHGR